METAESLREEILKLRGDIDRASCSLSERSFGESRREVLTLLQNGYGGSCLLYTAACTALPLAACLVGFLLYISARWINEKFMRLRVSRELRQCPVLQEELQKRTLTQASRRTARGRTLFVITIKCIVACAVLFTFMASRLAMVAAIRSWLIGFIVVPDDVDEEGLELYNAIFAVLRFDWLTELQGLIVFSTIGSGIMMVGLRLLRSAGDDAASLQSGSASLLHLITKIDNMHAAQKQNDLHLQMEQLKTLVTECILAGSKYEDDGVNLLKKTDSPKSEESPIVCSREANCNTHNEEEKNNDDKEDDDDDDDDDDGGAAIAASVSQKSLVITDTEPSQGEVIVPNKENAFEKKRISETPPPVQAARKKSIKQ